WNAGVGERAQVRFVPGDFAEQHGDRAVRFLFAQSLHQLRDEPGLVGAARGCVPLLSRLSIFDEADFPARRKLRHGRRVYGFEVGRILARPGKNRPGDPVRHLDDLAPGAVVAAEGYEIALSFGFPAEALEHADVGRAEAVDALFGVADHEEVAP